MTRVIVIVLLATFFLSCSRERAQKPEGIPLRLFSKIELNKRGVEKWGVYEPDTFVRFSPSGKYLAVGTFLGELILYHMEGKKILWKKKLAEGMVKKIDFSPNGRVVYVGEQSPDGFIYALRTADGKTLWRFNLSKDLGKGILPKNTTPYSIYRLPGCYRLKTLRGGDILVLGVHSYQGRRGWRRVSRIYRISPSGKVIWAFPKECPMEFTIIYMDSDPEGRIVAALSTLGSEGLDENYPYSGGTLYIIDGLSGEELGRYRFEPLKPYYSYVSFWQSVSVSEDGRSCAVGTSDGRVFIFNTKPLKVKTKLNLSTPIVIGGIPVAATSTYVLLKAGTLYVQTGPSSIPYSLRLKSSTPPGPHPNADTLWAVSFNGTAVWRFSPGRLFRFQGYAWDKTGRFIAVCADSTVEDEGEKVFGLFLFDTWKRGNSLDKLYAFYPTSSPCFFHLDMTGDGRFIAVVEVPYRSRLGKYIGDYKVLILERR